MRSRVAILVLFCLVAASCVSLKGPQLEKRLYTIDVGRPGVAAGPALVPEAVLVRRLEVSPAAAGRELAYRTGGSAWSADYYNRFFVAPADMLTQDLRTWLAASRVFVQVLDPGSLATHGYVLEGNVTALYGDFSVTPAAAVVEMQFLLLKDAGGRRDIVLSRGYREAVPLAATSPADVVSGLRTATGRIYGRLETNLRAALTAR